MKPLVNFLNNFVFSLFGVGVICGMLVLKSCGPVFPSLQGNTILDTELPYRQASNMSPAFIGSIPNQYDYIEELRECQRNNRYLEKIRNEEKARSNKMEMELNEVREQLSITSTELANIKSALADSSEALHDIRLDHDILQSEYKEEVQNHLETQEQLDTAEDTIELQYVIINELNQELVTVKKEAKRTFIASIILISMILIYSVLFWLHVKGIINFTRLIRKNTVS